ncbi:MAG: hypothetical protein WCG78_02210 [Candidatus Omnitrophota bacterium]
MGEQTNAGKNIIILIVVCVIGFLMWKGCQKEPTGTPPAGKPVIGKTTASVIGVWQFSAVTSDTLILRNDATFEVQVHGQTYNTGEYRIDSSVTPIHFSLIPKKVYWFAGYPASPLTKGIIRLTDKSVMELAFTPGAGRQIGAEFPATFEYPNIKVVLQRIK